MTQCRNQDKGLLGALTYAKHYNQMNNKHHNK